MSSKYEDASGSDARLAEEQSVAFSKIGELEKYAEQMYEDKSIIISEQESLIQKLRTDLASKAERHPIWTPANASISETTTPEFHNSPSSDK